MSFPLSLKKTIIVRSKWEEEVDLEALMKMYVLALKNRSAHDVKSKRNVISFGSLNFDYIAKHDLFPTISEGSLIFEKKGIDIYITSEVHFYHTLVAGFFAVLIFGQFLWINVLVGICLLTGSLVWGACMKIIYPYHNYIEWLCERLKQDGKLQFILDNK